jgi:cyclopropane fatty-acyl-phospholipid synthase-like methyltransferase
MYILTILAGIIVLIVGVWILVPIFYGVPWRATKDRRIRKALQLASLKPGETLYDLGSGDGRVLIIGAREFGASGVGIEVGPVQVVLSKLMFFLNGINSKVRVRREDFYRSDLRTADVVFAYLTSDQAPHLQKQFEKQLKNGARVVTISFDIPGWQPEAFDREDLIFQYTMPPVPGSLASFLGALK